VPALTGRSAVAQARAANWPGSQLAAFCRVLGESVESFDVLRYPIFMNRDKGITEGGTDTKCQHAAVEPLGSNNGMDFLRCVTCRSVIVTQGALSLAIPPAQTAG
jgi:hypothetical protein